MPKELSVIPQTTLNEQLILSLLDRFIDVTDISFGELASKFYQYTPDSLTDLKYHGRQVSFYMKRERPISPKHWYGIAEFVYSDEFIEKLPEARAVIRQQESTIEAGVYFAKLNGLTTDISKYGECSEQIVGYWYCGNGEAIYLNRVPGYPFAIIHGRSFESPKIWSGFIFPNQLGEQERRKAFPSAKSFEGLTICDVYLWDRLSREKFPNDTLPYFFLSEKSAMVTGISLNTYIFKEFVEPATRAIREGSHIGFKRLGILEKDVVDYFDSDEDAECTLCNIRPFLNFIDKNLWGVLGDGPDC